MSNEELEAEALKLDPQSRAKLAGKLLESLDELSEQEAMQIWAEEAQRRDAAMDSDSSLTRDAAEVFRDARQKLK